MILNQKICWRRQLPTDWKSPNIEAWNPDLHKPLKDSPSVVQPGKQSEWADREAVRVSQDDLQSTNQSIKQTNSQGNSGTVLDLLFLHFVSLVWSHKPHSSHNRGAETSQQRCRKNVNRGACTGTLSQVVGMALSVTIGHLSATYQPLVCPLLATIGHEKRNNWLLAKVADKNYHFYYINFSASWSLAKVSNKWPIIANEWLISGRQVTNYYRQKCFDDTFQYLGPVSQNFNRCNATTTTIDGLFQGLGSAVEPCPPYTTPDKDSNDNPGWSQTSRTWRCAASLFPDFPKGLVQWKSDVQPTGLPTQHPAMEMLNNDKTWSVRSWLLLLCVQWEWCHSCQKNKCLGS